MNKDETLIMSKVNDSFKIKVNKKKCLIKSFNYNPSLLASTKVEKVNNISSDYFAKEVRNNEKKVEQEMGIVNEINFLIFSNPEEDLENINNKLNKKLASTLIINNKEKTEKNNLDKTILFDSAEIPKFSNVDKKGKFYFNRFLYLEKPKLPNDYNKNYLESAFDKKIKEEERKIISKSQQPIKIQLTSNEIMLLNSENRRLY